MQSLKRFSAEVHRPSIVAGVRRPHSRVTPDRLLLAVARQRSLRRGG